jgi:hypothetical protein
VAVPGQHGSQVLQRGGQFLPDQRMPEHQLGTRACQDAGRRRLLQTRHQVRHRPAQHHGQVGDREPPAEQRGGAQHLRCLGGHRAEPVSQRGGQRAR